MIRAGLIHELLPPRVQLRHDRSQQHRLLPLHPVAERGGVQEEAVRALCGGGEGRAGANSGGAGFSFFTHHADKTEQNASVVVAESSGVWLDKDAERLGWLPGVKDRSANGQKWTGELCFHQKSKARA